MFDIDDIHPLTHFQRNTKAHIARLKETKRPEVLTVQGKPALVVQDAESYQQLLDQLEYLSNVEKIRVGLEEARAGLGRPAAEVFAETRAKYNIPKGE